MLLAGSSLPQTAAAWQGQCTAAPAGNWAGAAEGFGWCWGWRGLQQQAIEATPCSAHYYRCQGIGVASQAKVKVLAKQHIASICESLFSFSMQSLAAPGLATMGCDCLAGAVPFFCVLTGTSSTWHCLDTALESSCLDSLGGCFLWTSVSEMPPFHQALSVRPRGAVLQSLQSMQKKGVF